MGLVPETISFALAGSLDGESDGSLQSYFFCPTSRMCSPTPRTEGSVQVSRRI